MDDFTRHIVNSILNSDDDESDFDGFSDVGSDIEVPDVSDLSESDSDPADEEIGITCKRLFFIFFKECFYLIQYASY